MRADFRATAPASMIAKALAPGADVKAFVEEAREGFLAECDYEREARSQARFQSLYAEHPILESDEGAQSGANMGGRLQII